MRFDQSSASICAIVGGRVIDPSRGIDSSLNVFIENGVIVEVSGRAPGFVEGIVDAHGLIVAPGFIDMHVHLREPGQEYKEDIASGSAAAAAGGYTTVCCMPNTDPPNDSSDVTRLIKSRAQEAGLIDVIPVGALTKGLSGLEPSDLGALLGEGVKVFSDDGACIQGRPLMKKTLKWASENRCLVVDHAEDFSITGSGRVNEGKVSHELKLKGISRYAENSMIKRDLELARETGARIHIAHLSTIEGVEMIRRAKANNISVTCEVTPHHLLLKEDDVLMYGSNALMKPPLRTEEDRLALIGALADGTIDVIATDHAPHAPHEKADVKTAAFGVIGMETMLPVCLKLVHDGQLTMKRFIDAVSCAPARILNLQGKGTLGPGAAADITVFDPDCAVTVDARSFRSKSRNTPFDGWRLKGRVVCTITGGRVAFAASGDTTSSDSYPLRNHGDVL